MKIIDILVTASITMNITNIEEKKKHVPCHEKDRPLDHQPWLVSIQATNSEVGVHLCGGILIHPRWVVSTAHCLDSERPEWLWVVIGGNGAEQRIMVDNFYKHENYRHFRVPYRDDIALIHLKAEVQLNDKAAVANLSFQLPLNGAGNCRKVDWVERSNGTKLKVESEEAELLSSAECSQSFNRTDLGECICVRGNRHDNKSCRANSGGLLQCVENNNDAIMIVGILSWRSRCDGSHNPAVYMRTSSYLTWIIKTLVKCESESTAVVTEQTSSAPDPITLVSDSSKPVASTAAHTKTTPTTQKINVTTPCPTNVNTTTSSSATTSVASTTTPTTTTTSPLTDINSTDSDVTEPGILLLCELPLVQCPRGILPIGNVLSAAVSPNSNDVYRIKYNPKTNHLNVYSPTNITRKQTPKWAKNRSANRNTFINRFTK